MDAVYKSLCSCYRKKIITVIFVSCVDTVLGMDHFSSWLGGCNSVEEYISLTLVNSVLLGMDHYYHPPAEALSSHTLPK